MNKAAVYCRVSTDAQEREGSSLQTQLESCLKYCKEQNYEVIECYSETYSGLALHRPELDRMLEGVRRRDVDVVVVYCIDRLSRDPIHGVLITEEMDKLHVLLEAVSETVENSEVGRLITYIRGFASKLEAEKIKERTGRGKTKYIKDGFMPFGTGYGLYGYIWHKGGPKMGIKQPRTINEYEATIVRQIFKDLANGMGRFTIARKLNAAGIPSKSGAKWHPLTIGRMAKNAAYCGDTYVGQYKSDSQAKRVIQPRENWTLLPDITPPIIEKALFERVQAILSHPRAIQKSEYLLTGHVACAACGGPMCGARMAKLHRYYGCRHTMPTASEPATCKARYIRADFIEPFVWNKVIEVLKNPDVLLAEFKRQVKDKAKGIPARLEQDIKRLTYKIETYPAKEKHLVDELADEANDELRDALLDGLNRQRKECKEAKSQFATLLAQKQELKWSEPLRLNA